LSLAYAAARDPRRKCAIASATSSSSCSACTMPLGLLAVLAREHQLQERGVARGEADVGRRGRLQARLEVLARAVGGAAQLGAQARVPGLGERVQQRLAIGEVTPRRARTDADLARELAQRQLLHAPLAHGALGPLEQRRAEVAVVVGALAHRRGV